MRDDAGCTKAAIAALAGVDPSLITRLETRDIDPTLETYARVAAALGANLTARVYPDTGPSVRDRHQVRATECLLAVAPPALARDARSGRPPPGPRLGGCRPSRPGGGVGGCHGDRVATAPARAAAPVEPGEGRGVAVLACLAFVVSDGQAGDLQAPGRALDAYQPRGCPRRPEVAGGRLSGRSARCARRAHGNGRVDRPGAALGASRWAGRRPRPVAAVTRPKRPVAAATAAASTRDRTRRLRRGRTRRTRRRASSGGREHLGQRVREGIQVGRREARHVDPALAHDVDPALVLEAGDLLRREAQEREHSALRGDR